MLPKCIVALVAYLYLTPTFAQAQRQEVSLPDTHAHVTIPASCTFIGKAELEANVPMRALQSFESKGYRYLGGIVPSEGSRDWVVVLMLRDCGHVDLSNAVAEAADPSNNERLNSSAQRASGVASEIGIAIPEEIHLIKPITYDVDRKAVEFSIAVRLSGAEPIEQHQYILFGAESVLAASTQGKPADLTQLESWMHAIDSSLRFDTGYSYSDFNPGVHKLSGFNLRTYLFGATAFSGFAARVLIGCLGSVVAIALALLLIDPGSRRALLSWRKARRIA